MKYDNNKKLNTLQQCRIRDQIKEILSKPCDLYPFYDKYLDIERLLIKNVLSDEIIIHFTNDNKCEFRISTKDKNLTISLSDGEKTIATLGRECTMYEVQNLCEKIDNEIRDRRLFFTPKADALFVNDILSAKKGDIFSFNNRNSFVCVDKNEKRLVFKYAYNGDIGNIKIGDFEKSDTFYIQNENSQDLQYMYSLAYDYRSTSVLRRKYDFTLGNGYYHISEIEQNHRFDEITEFNVGNCKLRLINNGDLLQWYDSNGKEINRDTIAILFAWTKTVAADISFENKHWFPSDEIDKDVVCEVNEALVNNNTEQLLALIKNYTAKNNNYSSITFEGLYQCNELDLVPVVFSFAIKDNQLLVYKREMDEAKRYEESSIEEFLDFYSQRYENVKNITIKEFKNLTQREQDLIFQKIVEKSSNKGILGRVSSEEQNEINTIMSSYLQDKVNEKGYVPITDIMIEDYDDYDDM